ncbi:MAG: nitrous oxide-stimulated promoter family protein [Acidobacteriota bacterium]
MASLELLTAIKDVRLTTSDVRHMGGETRRLRRERRTVHAMIALYCRAHHRERRLCESCRGLATYADRRLDRCAFGPDKPTCANCPVHCYGAEPRERVREVMRWAGPRMLWRHPVLAVFHLIDGRHHAPELPRRRWATAASDMPGRVGAAETCRGPVDAGPSGTAQRSSASSSSVETMRA